MALKTSYGPAIWKMDVVQFSLAHRVYLEEKENTANLNMLMMKGLLKNADEDDGEPK